YDTPVLLRLSTRVSHSQSILATSGRPNVPLREYKKDPAKYVMMPAFARAKHVVVEARTEKLTDYAETAAINTVEYNDTSIGIITSGVAYQYAKEAMGDSASYLKLGMVYPLPVKLIEEFAAKVDRLYVVEELDDIIETHCKKLGISVVGKELFTYIGEYSQRLLREKLAGVTVKPKAFEETVPVRPPVMCPGCPHRGLFYSLNKLGVTVFGDIGCYTLGAAPPLGAIDTTICMGASISGLHGFNKARGKDSAKDSVAVIGDSTFMHSGVTGLIDIAYNQGVSTVLILDNSITGMTGHQQNPTTGLTIKGDPTAKISIEKLCEAVGINRVRVVDPNDVKKVITVIKEELAAEEPSVVIARRPCALLKTVKRGKPLVVDREKCRACRACFKIGCPAISMVDGKAAIDNTLCFGCGLCSSLCPFDAMAVAKES
ncbi:MAG: thiamine pyrophosphate-dependent enzyme, partial [Acetanaerobacterium sp.]